MLRVSPLIKNNYSADFGGLIIFYYYTFYSPETNKRDHSRNNGYTFFNCDLI